MKKFLEKKNYYSIFLFHGVVKHENFSIRNYTKKHITDKKFDSILEYLKKRGNPISLEELVYHKKNNINLPKKSFIITFDDGFENNYSIAAPILDNKRLPCTFYFSTDFIENQNISWIDQIEICLEHTKKREIINPLDNKNFIIDTNEKKIKFLNILRKKLKKDFNYDLNNVVKNICLSSKINPYEFKNKELDKKISWAKVKKLKSSNLFTIGGHSHKHISLASISKKEAINQINKSFYLFKKRINLKLTHYSYPEGQKIDYNKNLIKILKNKGIISCPTAIKGHNNLFNDDLFHLKRIMI